MIKVLFSVLLLLPFGQMFGQNVLEGVIKDAGGLPIIGGTVVIKGTTIHAVTDPEGTFRLETSGALPFTVVFSAVGFKPQELEIYEAMEDPVEIILKENTLLEEVVITARRRTETAQSVPIPVSVISGDRAGESGAFNVNRLKEIVPSVQLYSSNPRNTGINIRGLGSPFGLTNDGLDPGVGFYVDGVYFARPAVATLDFIDVERIEVLRGPQGTLFGKNTTAGAFNITTKKPSFTPAADFELSYGNFGYVQAKSSLTGPIVKEKLAARISFSGTQRDGTIYNEARNEYVNDMNNLGVRGQLLFTPSHRISVALSADQSKQQPNGYAQVVAGVVETQRPRYRQFNNIIADLNYSLPTPDPFDRVIDHDTPWRSENELGGISLNGDIEIGKGTLTTTTAWRYWNWGPSNDRDFTGLQSLAKSQNPSKHHNWSQEVRYSGQVASRIGGVIGFFFMDQSLATNGTEESGTAQWRFSQNSTSDLWKTPGLLEGYGAHTNSSITSMSAAVFANMDWSVTEKLHVRPGLRYNYDEKQVSYERTTYGGLQTDDPELIALKQVVYQDQSFTTSANEKNLTYQLTLSYMVKKHVNSYVTYSTGYKPVGVNVAGLPVIDGKVAVELGTIRPEYVQHIEAGVKTSPTNRTVLNATVYNTNIDDYQTNVQSPQLGVNRGYIATAEKVNVRGGELDGSIRVSNHLSVSGSLAYIRGVYVRFTNAPLPLEETGASIEGTQVAFKDISGARLPGISKWSGSLSTDCTSNELSLLGQNGKVFGAFDVFFRSQFSSSPSPSKYLNIDGYSIVNIRAGFRAGNGLSLFLWTRNALNKDYFEQLLPAGGNAGHFAAVLGDPRTYGLTIRYSNNKL
ncbi:MAG TPA: TonB-dependent receptor [Chryseosolibacter sp.]|nr:TonB-dependent receptor [Chryseosolibacter sp.]